MRVRKLRVLRLKYHISLTELSQTSGLSSQRISQLELSTGHVTDGTVQKLLDGLDQAISQRLQSQFALQADFQKHRDSLMELVGETDHVI